MLEDSKQCTGFAAAWSVDTLQCVYYLHGALLRGRPECASSNVDNCDGDKEVILGSPLPTLLAYSQEKTF